MNKRLIAALGAASLIVAPGPALALQVVNGTTGPVNDFHIELDEICAKFILITVVPCEIAPGDVVPAKGRAPWAGDYDTAHVYDKIGWSGAAINPGEALDIPGLNIAASTYQGFTITRAYWTFGGTEIPGGVPEPASWAMMIAGFALAGWGMRRRDVPLVSRRT